MLPFAAYGMEVSLSGVPAEAVQVGRTITLTGAASSADAENVMYRFRVRRPGMDYRMIRDYGPVISLDWAAHADGPFEIELSVKDILTGDVASTSQLIDVASRVQGDQPVVNPTDNPLVFLFSAPPCADGGRMRVVFGPPGGSTQQTPFVRCRSGVSMNFYLAGLYSDTTYSATALLDTGSDIVNGPGVTFQTATAPSFSFTTSVVKPARATDSQPFLLGTTGGGQIVTDLEGNAVWYNTSPVTYATSFDTGGYIWGFMEDKTRPVQWQGIRKVDLAGHTVLETNAARVSEQLVARGEDKISGFHHEVRTLPDGRIAALATVERVLSDVQGPGPIDILGDLIIIFDQNLQVLWTWNAFDHLDVTRKATLNETCTTTAGGCPPIYLADSANDWTHGNALQQTPDGNLLYSCRHQDWLIKIAYANGEGDGHIMWKLGKDGDFAFQSTDPWPWFSHQHDGKFESANRLVVFDNGNPRIVANQGAGNSRGQVITLDEQNRTARLVLNVDLGVNAMAVGSAQRLLDGNYHFNAGFVASPDGILAFAIEVDPEGHIISTLSANALIYRSIRMATMYSID